MADTNTWEQLWRKALELARDLELHSEYGALAAAYLYGELLRSLYSGKRSVSIDEACDRVARRILGRIDFVRDVLEIYAEALGFPGRKKYRVVVDLGCGTGTAIHVCSAILELSCYMVGVDLDLEALRVAKLLAPWSDFIQADARCAPFRSGVADLVFCVGVFHENPSPTPILEEVSRVLVDSGSAVIVDFASSSVLGPVFKIARCSQRAMRMKIEAPYTAKEIIKAATRCGLKITRTSLKEGALVGRIALLATKTQR